VIGGETELMRELLSLRMELRPGGGVGIEASPGKHDDLAMAAMLACGPYRHKGLKSERRAGQWRSRLTDAAEWGVPETSIATASRDVVETGGGLRLPRVPVVQSVFGNELSVPGDLARAA
jgi:hypothetical protein